MRATKVGNQARLKELLKTLGLERNYDALVVATKHGFGDSLYGQWPNWSGYSFYHLEENPSTGKLGNLVYLGLFAPKDRNGEIQIVLHARAVESVGAENVKNFASAMGSNFLSKPSGSGEIWTVANLFPSIPNH